MGLKDSIKNILPVTIKRLISSYYYDKEKFLLKNDHTVFSTIAHENRWNAHESLSGGGSTLEATQSIRTFLTQFIEDYAIQTFLDVPCGDYNWMSKVEKKCHYFGGDIVPALIQKNQKKYASPLVQFRVIDITKDPLPQVDLIFCKDCFQHLSYQNIKKAINNFKSSGSKWLLVTSYPKTLRNHDIYDGDYHPLNLFKKPFYFPKPILKIWEQSKAPDVEIDKTMYLFELKDIPTFREVA
jgi:SAM-dependent methyltransferase